MGYNAEYIIFVKIDSGERRNIICGIMKEMGFSRNRTNIWKFNFHILVGILVFIFISGLLFWVAPVAYAGEVVFETSLPWYYSWLNTFWGSDSITRTSEFAIRYTPIANQEVCAVKTGLYKSGNPIDDVIMTVREGGNGHPTNGLVLRTKVLPGANVANPPVIGNQSAYTSFTFSPCLHLIGGVNYFFLLSRTQLAPLIPTNQYVSQASNLIYYSKTAVWAYASVNGSWQEKINFEPALRLEGPDMKEPVIIVPGILGSRLNRVSDGEEVWPSMRQMIDPIKRSDDYLDELKLDNNGNEILDMNSPEVIESTLGFNQYGNLIQKFKDSGYELGRDLFVVPYDWRLDIATSSLELDSIVNEAVVNSPTGKVSIIAHSMGGLLVKDYLMRKGDLMVSKLIFAGTPHLGSPKAFNVLNYGDDFDIKLLVLGLNKNKAKEISQNMPAVYELLPSREYISEAGSYVQDNQETLDYDQTSEFMTSDSLLSDHRNSGLLDVADQFHQSHDSWLPQSSDVYNLMGCREYDTIGSFNIDSDGSIDIDSVNGDGTVPLISAEHVPGKNYFVSYPETKINHSGLISDDRTIGLLYNFIASDSEPILATGIYKTSADCDNIINEVKRLRFSTHSPVNLHVYDLLGNHTGLTPEGNIEMNIPDSEFVQVGDNSFIFVPDGVQYSVEIDAYATGSFDFKVKELSNGEVQDSVSYEDIPIDNPDLKADFEFTDIDSPSPLNVDENGDDEDDFGYSPDGSRDPKFRFVLHHFLIKLRYENKKNSFA